MHVTIGPVSSASALSYIAMVRERLPSFNEDDFLGRVLTPYVLEQTEELLVAWESAARASDPFTWDAELEPAVVEHLTFAFYQVVKRSYAMFEQDVETEESRERGPFRIALTNALLDALEAEGKGSSELAVDLREAWPDDDIT